MQYDRESEKEALPRTSEKTGETFARERERRQELLQKVINAPIPVGTPQRLDRLEAQVAALLAVLPPTLIEQLAHDAFATYADMKQLVEVYRNIRTELHQLNDQLQVALHHLAVATERRPADPADRRSFDPA